MRAHFQKIAVLACLGLAGAPLPLRGALPEDTERPLEYPVKAALLLNFAKFAEWPANSAQARAVVISICVLGQDPFGDILEKTLAGRSAAKRPVVVRRPQGVDELHGCHILFVASSEHTRLGQIIASVANQPILTVGESGGFARMGGMIGLVVEHDLVRFEVNLAAAQQRRLQLSSKLLGLARLVAPPNPSER